MSTTSELRAVRQWFNESRWRLLDGFIVVNDAVKAREVESKRQLVAALCGLDEFANSTAYQEYRPS
ncbi:hypothetical protein [Streptomyces sp. NPDC048663]|uniref:hypothetical protein n=1 Tax=Streptomyces sp. NPDC048663 TaxID=3155638 RepID=UPI00342C84C6